MAKTNENLSPAETAKQRFNLLFEPLLEQGLTQVQIAAQIGIPPQYFSDIKRGGRPVTELMARKLGEQFNCNYRWLLGLSNTMEVPTQPSTRTTARDTVLLPLFPFPIEGEPRQHAKWNGVSVELAGVAAGKVGLARYPYVLQFGHNDVQGRLKQGDLILMSQAPKEAAEIHVVRPRKKLYLARANEDGSWSRLAGDYRLPDDCPATGHCIGVVWSALV